MQYGRFVTKPTMLWWADPRVYRSAGPADVAGAAGILVQTPEVSELEIALLRLVLAAFTIGS